MERRKTRTIPAWWHVFIGALLANGENAAQAYLTARPRVTLATAKSQACVLLKDPNFSQLLAEKKKQTADAVDFTREEYFRRITATARFSVMSLFARDPKTGATKLRRDWLDRVPKEIAGKVRVTASKIETKPNAPLLDVQQLAFEPHSSMEAVEKLGRLLGYDTSDEPAEQKGDLVINIGAEYRMVDEPAKEKAAKK